MVYETSYESGRTPFKSNINRGYWASPSDFLYACWGQTFKLDAFTTWFFFDLGIFTVIPYMIALVLFVVPIIVIQLFMGQFSSSGFISVFRIAPLFKGMGYISLAVDLSILTYYSTFGAVPLLFLLNSLRPTIPWSCEAVKEWSIENDQYHLCNVTHDNSSDPVLLTSEEMETSQNNTEDYKFYHIPSEMYFRNITKYLSFDENHITESPIFIAWQLVGCMILVWSLIALVFIKLVDVDMVGKFMRYSVWLLMAMLLLCIGRFVFLPGAQSAIEEYFRPSMEKFAIGIFSIPVLSVSSFGMGWGALISLASHNRFRTNVMRYSWFVCLGHLVIIVLLGLMSSVIDHHYKHITNDNYYAYAQSQWMLYLSPGSALASMEWPNVWSVLFFGLQLLAAVLVIVTQLFSILTALFDEFEFLRRRKQEVTFALIGALALCSIYFCSNHGLVFFSVLSVDAFFTQTALNLLLLLVVLWVYGRVRFQRDIEFMLGQRFATWRINMLRFVAPAAVLLFLYLSSEVGIDEHMASFGFVNVLSILLISLPWLFIPGYAAFGLFQTSGPLLMRFKRCCHPTDWYPAVAEERQRYEDDMGNLDITHQLQEVGEEAS